MAAHVLARGDEPIIQIRADAKLHQTVIGLRGRFAGVGQQNHSLAGALQLRERIDRRRWGMLTIVQHAPLVDDKKVVVGRYLGQSGDDRNGHGANIVSGAGLSIAQSARCFFLVA